MSRLERIKEHIKSLVLGVLLVTLVCLCVIYILSFSGESYDFDKNTMEAVSGESVKYQYLDYWDISYSSPRVIGLSAKREGDNIGFYTLGGENIEVYESIFPFFEKLFGEEGNTEKLSSAEGAALFSSLLKGDYIYLSYACDLPKSLIYAMTQGEATYKGTSDEFFSELLIVPLEYLFESYMITPAGKYKYVDVYSFYAVARDSSGNYYRYTTSFQPSAKSDIAFHTNFYTAYNTADNRFQYEFAGEWKSDSYLTNNGFYEKVTDTTMIPLAKYDAYSAPIVLAKTQIPDSTAIYDILNVFMMNPEKISSYTDENNTVFYFDEGKNISITKDGVLSYTTHGSEGISLAELFDWHAEGEQYDVFDHIGAALVASRTIEKVRSLVDCDVYISGIYYDGNLLKIRFGYSEGGLPLYFDGDADVLTLEFSDGRITGAAYQLLRVRVAEENAEVTDLLWTIRSEILSSNKRNAYHCGYGFWADVRRSGLIWVSREQ